MNIGRLAEAFSIVIVLALVATAVWFGVRPTAAPVAFVGPSPEELDSLSKYLQPVEAAPEIDNYDMFVPAGEAAIFPLPPSAAAEEAAPRSRRLTAILTVGDRPIAIIDDEQVTAGAVLPGGTEVVEIGRSEVTLREPNGSRRTLRISANAGT